MVVSASDYDETIAGHIKTKQQLIMMTLIDKLGYDTTAEDNLNAGMIINDLIELKECYNLISLKMHI